MTLTKSLFILLLIVLIFATGGKAFWRRKTDTGSEFPSQHK